MRTKVEALIDRILLLYAVDRGNAYGCMDGPFKLMKIPFMAELESVQHGINTFNYTFYRYDHGPMTTEIYEDIEQLKMAGLLEVPDDKCAEIKLTAAGKKLFDTINGLIQANAEVCAFIDESAKKYAPMSFKQLKDTVYEQRVRIGGKVVRIGDVPHFCDVIGKLQDDDVKRFQIDDDWIDTLWGYLNYTPDELASMHCIRPMQSIGVPA
jgi:hypothetical protein